jgi:hypothetical protein
MFRLNAAGALLIAVAFAASCANDESLRRDGPLGPSAQFQEVTVAASVPLLVVNAPASIAGSYAVGTAFFGPPLTPSGVTGDVILALDGANAAGPSTTDACSPLTNGAQVTGKIALVDRGTCAFVIKVKNAQNSGAIAVIVADNVTQTGPPQGLGGVDPTIAIPSVRISLADGNLIKNELAVGSVNATLQGPGGAEEQLGDVAGDLEATAAANPGTPLSDKAEDALNKVEAARQKLQQTPPDRQGALGELEGAVGDLEAAVKDGLLAADGTALMNQIAGAARLLAEQAIEEARAGGGDAGKITEAEQALAEGDAQRAAGHFKDAVAKYKDAVAKAEGA